MSKRPWAVYCGLGALVLAVYGMTLGAPFVIDDLGFVRDNAVFKLPFWAFAREVCSADYARFTGEGTYQPLVTFLHYFIHESPLYCRLTGVTIHAVNSILVFFLCRRLSANDETSFLAAVLFAVFPASTEAVNLSAFKGHLLAFTFGAGALLAWSGPWSVPLYGLALLSKETALIVPVFACAQAAASRGPGRRRDRAASGAVLVMTAAYLVLRFVILKPLAQTSASSIAYSPWLSLGWYLRMLPAPYPLCLAHGALPPTRYILLVLPVVFLAALWAARKNPLALFCLAWILVSLLPYLQLIPLKRPNPVCDRYLYMASAGFCALAAATLGRPRLRWALYALILSWGALAILRNDLYRDPQKLYEQTAACAPDAPQAHSLLGDYLFSVRDYRGARASYEQALALDPWSPDAVENIGIAQFLLGDARSALPSLQRALSVEPGSARVYYNLGAFYASQKNPARARDLFHESLSRDPDYQPAAAALHELEKTDSR